MSTRLFSFIGGDPGLWRVAEMGLIAGEPPAAAKRLEIASGSAISSDPHAAWVPRGMTSNERYAARDEERSQLGARQQALGCPGATCAALIPIRKNAAWWMLTQNERQSVFETQSRHAQIGLQHFPSWREGFITAGISRRLSHSISSTGLNARRFTRRSSTRCLPRCVQWRNGSMSSARLTSALCVRRPDSIAGTFPGGSDRSAPVIRGPHPEAVSRPTYPLPSHPSRSAARAGPCARRSLHPGRTADRAAGPRSPARR